MLFECHGHIMMDGRDYASAVVRHKNGIDVHEVRQSLEYIQRSGIGYFRDGGDNLGVSLRAKELAGEYGIEYVTPGFAIYKKGYYGGIVGFGWSSTREFLGLVRKAGRLGCDFIKLMLSGIITFNGYGELSCPSLPDNEITELMRAAHGEGYKVMAHVNGAGAIRAALIAGVDSIEHGYFMDEECLGILAGSGAVWVPTLSAVAAFRGRSGFDGEIVDQTLQGQLENVRRAAALGAYVASGSDAGAVGVPHGKGAIEEKRLLTIAGADADGGSRRIQTEFRR